jgi:endonuclease/exonuclease/phosphatase family metal-dependent hydrolase
MGRDRDRVRRPLRSPGWVPLVLGVGVAIVAGSACATVNYLDPTGPSYETRLADAAHSPPPPGSPLRVVTFNIAFAVKVDLALEVLRESPSLRGLDVLVLQEMDAPSVERIARALKLNSLYVPSAVHPKSDRDFGCAILSPWPLVEPGKVVLPFAAFGSRVRRSVARATVRRGDERVRVYSVHLPSPLGVTDYARREQLKVIFADAAGSPDPVVIAGDFNSNDLGERFVEAGYGWITRDVDATARFLFFGLSFDHVFARGLVAAPGLDSFGVVRENRGASDHRPVWAVLVRPHASGRGESH